MRRRLGKRRPAEVSLGSEEIDRAERARLDTLVELFKQLQADTADLIAYIKELKKAGKLHARLSVE